MSMVENIRRIGIFIIAAQTLIHFAAGKQYEKYMKVIAGVIVLLQFVRPFVSSPDNVMETWQEEIERMEQQIEEQSSTWQNVPYAASPAEAAALQQIEEEIKNRLNEVTPDRDRTVTDVTLNLEQTDGSIGQGDGAGERSWIFRCVKVTVQDVRMGAEDVSDKHENGSIRIEKIIVGSGSEETETGENTLRDTESDYNIEMEEYRRLFAQTLGVPEDRVEVTYLGGW